jgi:hypothetical protein
MRNSFIWTAALLAGMVLAYPYSGEGSWTAGPSALSAMNTNFAAQSKKKDHCPRRNTNPHPDDRLHRHQQAKDR